MLWVSFSIHLMIVGYMKFPKFLKENGTIHKITCIDTPLQMGKICYLLEVDW
jgi:hypothetical protein